MLKSNRSSQLPYHQAAQVSSEGAAMSWGDDNDRLAELLNDLGARFRELGDSQTPAAVTERAAIVAAHQEALLPRLRGMAHNEARRRGISREAEDLQQTASLALLKNAKKLLLGADSVLALSVFVAKEAMDKYKNPSFSLVDNDEETEEEPDYTRSAEEVSKISTRLALLTKDFTIGKPVCIFHPNSNGVEHGIVLKELRLAGLHSYSVSQLELKTKVGIAAGLSKGDIRLHRNYIICMYWFVYEITGDEVASMELAQMVEATVDGGLNHDRCSPTGAAIRMWHDSGHPELKKLIKKNLLAQVRRGEIDDVARMSLEKRLENG
jgi:hypothetical protein